MADEERKALADSARGAAWTLVHVWKELGSDYADYEVVWEGKEYLFEAADKLDHRVPDSP